MIVAEHVSERRFPGLLAWIGSIVLLSWASGLLSAVAVRTADGRIWDLTRLAVLDPLVTLFAAAIIVVALAFALRQSIPAVMNALLPWTPFILAPGLIDLVLRWFGVIPVLPTYLNIEQTLSAALTAGLLPKPLASYGTLLVFLGMAIAVWKSVLRLTKSQRRAIAAGLIVSVSLTLLLSVPSVIGWFGLANPSSALTVGGNTVERGLGFLSLDAYWWNNVYERFPGSLDGEAGVSVELLMAALAFLAVAALLKWYWIRRFNLGWRDLVRLLRPKMMAFLATWAFSGFLLALFQGAKPGFGFVDLVSWLVFFSALGFAFIASVLRNDLADLADDAVHEPDRALASGRVSPSLAREAAWLLSGLSLVGGWILGWPVFVSVATYILARALYDSPTLRLKRAGPWRAVVLGIADLSFLFAGWFFGVEHAAVSKFPSGLALGALAFGILFSTVKSVDAGDGQARQRAGFAVAAGYVLLPILAGWWSWLILAIPIAAVSYLFLAAPTYKESRVYLFFYAFAVASVFWLAVLHPGS